MQLIFRMTLDNAATQQIGDEYEPKCQRISPTAPTVMGQDSERKELNSTKKAVTDTNKGTSIFRKSKKHSRIDERLHQQNGQTTNVQKTTNCKYERKIRINNNKYEEINIEVITRVHRSVTIGCGNSSVTGRMKLSEDIPSGSGARCKTFDQSLSLSNYTKYDTKIHKQILSYKCAWALLNLELSVKNEFLRVKEKHQKPDTSAVAHKATNGKELLHTSKVQLMTSTVEVAFDQQVN
ncbi:uncharacterized protein LOC134352228 [Mobula hypostoma]|uniref:uncharacterized protein LOC134352228 n=1 Tax=Mobula hypostoma TaxID=723540 RepID=UPI002FC2927F